MKKVEMTGQQYEAIRKALISARVEVAFILKKHEQRGESRMIPGVKSSLQDINEAYVTTDFDKVTITY